MAGTRMEALSRMDVQSGIQRDLFAKADEQMARHRANKASASQSHMHRRGLQYAHSGFHIAEDEGQFLSPITRLVVLALVAVLLSPVASAFWGSVL
ncbi:hypothetical protein [uncultured Pelagimonas sp.]|uniref:hypothetical protein n=1 Tax=uncultured Pelagimonas sp. TaxID=1618102 RepID=UPI002633EFB8|nr:hypothetical protein [uncultured Pelagimonas sp.]